MTVTEAAAANMTRKIQQRLEEAAAAAQSEAQRRQLEAQLLALPFARISTIHAFCLGLVRQFGYLLDAARDGHGVVAPDDRVIDPAEELRRREAALDALVDEASMALDGAPDKGADGADPASGIGEDVAALLDVISEDELRETLSALHGQLRALPRYPMQLEAARRAYHAQCRDFAASPVAAWYLEAFARRLEPLLACREEIEALLGDREAGVYAPTSDKNLAQNAEIAAALDALLQLAGRLYDDLNAGRCGWSELEGLAAGLDFPAMRGRNRHDSARALRSLVNDVMKPALAPLIPRARSYRDYMDGIFQRGAAALADELRLMAPFVDQLCRVVLELDRRLLREREAQSLLSFADFEHLALALLAHAPVRDWLANEVDELYVDEFQDTSALQNEILNQLAPGRRFAVGDVKQSIYRFRHAAPALFVALCEAAVAAPEDTRLHRLSANFRSQPAILEQVNRVFARAMTAASSRIDYRDGHALVPGLSADPARPAPLVRLGLLKQVEGGWTTLAGESDGEDDLSLSELESLEQQTVWAATEILRLRQSGAAEAYRDFAILARSNQAVQRIARQLAALGIPVSETGEEGFMRSWELSLLDMLLRLINNRRQDIPLLACLRQLPLYGRWTDGELLALRAAALEEGGLSRDSHFHLSVSWYQAHGPDDGLRRRLGWFFAWLDALDDYAQEHSLVDVTRRIIEELGLEELLSAVPQGAERLDALSRFVAWLAAWEPIHGRDLGRLAVFLETERRRRPDDSLFDGQERVEDAVAVTTMHRAKGIEYPHVFVLGLETRYRQGRSRSVLLHEALGLATRIAPPDLALRWPSAAHYAIETQERWEEQAEELRLLYVAMTRAEHSLTLVGRVEEAERLAERLTSRAIPVPASGDDGWPLRSIRPLTSSLDLLLGVAFAERPAEQREALVAELMGRGAVELDGLLVQQRRPAALGELLPQALAAQAAGGGHRGCRAARRGGGGDRPAAAATLSLGGRDDDGAEIRRQRTQAPRTAGGGRARCGERGGGRPAPRRRRAAGYGADHRALACAGGAGQ